MQQYSSLLKKQKKSILDFWKGAVKVLYNVPISYQYKMTKYNTLNVKLSNSQLNKLKPGIKCGTPVTSKFSSDVVSDSNDETNYPHKLLSTDLQVSRIRITFVSGSSANKKHSKSQLSEMVQSGGFIDDLLILL